MTITLKTYNSKFFPVAAVWKIGTVDYSAVYASKTEAVNHLAGRFGAVEIVDKTEVIA